MEWETGKKSWFSYLYNSYFSMWFFLITVFDGFYIGGASDFSAQLLLLVLLVDRIVLSTFSYCETTRHFCCFSRCARARFCFFCLVILHVINYVKFFFRFSFCIFFLLADNLLFADVLCYGFATYFLHGLFHLILSANANPYWR